MLTYIEKCLGLLQSARRCWRQSNYIYSGHISKYIHFYNNVFDQIRIYLEPSQKQHHILFIFSSILQHIVNGLSCKKFGL